MTNTPTAHLWLQGDAALESWLASAPEPNLGSYDGDRRLRGAYTAAGSLLRAKVPALLSESPSLAQRHDLEILAAAPELGSVLTNTRTSLTSEADPQTRTRYYPHNRINWIGNGLTDLVLQLAANHGPEQVLVITNIDHLDATDNDWLAGLVRRSNPDTLRLVLASRTATIPAPLGAALARYASTRGVADAPGTPAPYDELASAHLPEWHDAEADRLEALGEASLMLGAVLYHRERGTDPTRAAVAISSAMQTCLMVGFYDQVVELGKRAAPLLSWEDDEQARWLATVKMTIAYQAMGMPDEAMELFDDACANSLLPSVHMQSAYGRAMVYTRYYEEARRDLRKAKGLVNTAVALAGLSTDAQRRAYNRTFNENGLALIDMHLGNLDDAVELIEGGISRLDSEVEQGRFLLHRSVLRYNHAQLMVRTASLEHALNEYDAIIEEDPNHPDYYFDRAGLLVKAGRDEDAIADYTAAVTVGPPYAEPYYNRGEILMRLGDLDGAVRDFTRVLDLDPTFVDAYVNRASLLFEIGDLGQAESDVREGLELAPDHAHLQCLSGLVHQGSGRLDEARRAYETAVATDPELAGAWANLGIVCFEQGNLAEARECLERSLSIEDDETVRANLEVALAA